MQCCSHCNYSIPSPCINFDNTSSVLRSSGRRQKLPWGQPHMRVKSNVSVVKQVYTLLSFLTICDRSDQLLQNRHHPILGGRLNHVPVFSRTYTLSVLKSDTFVIAFARFIGHPIPEQLRIPDVYRTLRFSFDPPFLTMISNTLHK